MKTKIKWVKDEMFSFALAGSAIFGGIFREPYGDGLYVPFISQAKEEIFAPCKEDEAKAKVEIEFSKARNRK